MPPATTLSPEFAPPLVAPVDRVRPAWQGVLALCVGQVLLWGLAFGLTYNAPEIDSAEQFIWSFSMESGYWKHPPMPSWIMHLLLQVFGPSIALPFVATQVCIVLALALTWRLGCHFMSPQRSLVAMALTSLVTYHNLGGDNFNHSLVVLPFQAATTLFFYQATRRGDLRLWALTGLFAGLGMLVKYVALLPIAGLVLYLLLDRRLHHRRTWQGLAMATLVFVLVLTPHAIWLKQTNFLPFQYAHSVAQPMAGWLAGVRSLLDFGLTQLYRTLPLLACLGYVFWPRKAAHLAADAALLPVLPAQERLFLWVTALSPLVLTVVYAIASRTELQSRWGTNAFLCSGLLVMALVRRADSPLMLRRVLVFVVATHVLLSVGMTVSKTVLADHLHRKTRANFPGAVLARNAMQVWKAHTDAPLRLVVSDIWLGGNIVAHSPQRVAVLIDGYLLRSPWVDADAVRDCGALVLDNQTTGATGASDNSPALNDLMARATDTGVWNLPWAVSQQEATDQASDVIRWGVIPPAAPGACKIH
ncbi:glycosyltransferase family 39 protein [Rhodoferax sp. WC2427]|uniref:glycosyltransferase family 39 protein n=1 Tax=Rhodoferax sp. WC2427 TaxID=3234144 RepID=UPI003467B5B6